MNEIGTNIDNLTIVVINNKIVGKVKLIFYIDFIGK
jgi:hypothetical protein